MIELPLWHMLAARCALALRRHRGRFPEDMSRACTTAAVALGIVYRHHRVPFRFANTWLKEWHSWHGWVVVGETSVDLTATQFGFEPFVYLRPVHQGFKTRAPGHVFRAYRAKKPRDVWHPGEPRRNYDVLVPTLADVLGVTRTEARGIAREFIGPEVRP